MHGHLVLPMHVYSELDHQRNYSSIIFQEVLRALKSDLRCDEAFHYAEYVSFTFKIWKVLVVASI